MKISNQWSLPDHVMPQKYCVVPQNIGTKIHCIITLKRDYVHARQGRRSSLDLHWTVRSKPEPNWFVIFKCTSVRRKQNASQVVKISNTDDISRMKCLVIKGFMPVWFFWIFWFWFFFKNACLLFIGLGLLFLVYYRKRLPVYKHGQYVRPFFPYIFQLWFGIWSGLACNI
jgi:hypothetical protein